MIYDIQHQSNFESSHIAKRATKSMFLHQQSIKSSVDISTTLQLQEILRKQCRICLQNDEDTQQNPFVSPCKCIGSVKYVHEKCYRRWIQKQFESKQKSQQLQILQKGIKCQMCRQSIHLQFKSTYNCTSCEKFVQKVHKSKLLFFLFLFFSIGNIGCLSYLSVYSFENTDTLKNSLATLVMIIVSFVFLGITLVVTSYCFVTDFFFNKVWKLKTFGMKSRNNKVNPHQVHPISVQQLPE